MSFPWKWHWNFCDWSYDLRFTFIYCGTKVKACLRKIVVDVFARTTSDDVVLLANLLGKILCEYVLSFVLQYIYIFYPIYLKCVKYFLHALFHSNSLSLTHFIHITLTYSLSLIQYCFTSNMGILVLLCYYALAPHRYINK